MSNANISQTAATSGRSALSSYEYSGEASEADLEESINAHLLEQQDQPKHPHRNQRPTIG